MADVGFTMAPLHGVGVEIDGVDLRDQPSAALIAGLREALGAHHLLLLRGQELTPERQVEFVSWFGPVLESGGQRHGYVSNVRPDGLVPEGPLLFHSDMSFTATPYLGLCLHALEVPAHGADTLFANAAAAVEALGPEPSASARRLTVRNTAGFRVNFAERQREADVDPREPRHDHPLVGPHRASGLPVVYANECASVRIPELEEAESDALLEQVLAVLYDDGNVYAHPWRPGDVILWDNIAVQHGRRDVDPAEPRTLQRVVMADSECFEMTPEVADLYQYASVRRAKEPARP